MLEDDSSGESCKPNHSVDRSYFDSYCNPGIHHEMLTVSYSYSFRGLSDFLDKLSFKCEKFLKFVYFPYYANRCIILKSLCFQDSVRTLAYKDAILNNESIFAGKTVLDLGCGTGMLSMFAASVPSQKVFAIDNSDIAYYAVEIIK